LAHDGLLVDVSDIIAPIADQFDPGALGHVMLYNSKTRGRSYYALPIAQATIHMHAWKPLLEAAGLRVEDIPGDWDGFWSFWCDVVQPAVRKATGDRRIYGIGMPMSSATDTEGF
jgi:multiple sugar transport system substrate-binding protein